MDVDQLGKSVDPARVLTVEIPDVESIIERASLSPALGPRFQVRQVGSRRLAVAWLGVVAVLVVALVVGLRFSSSPKSNGLNTAGKVAVDVNATPKGWVPVDYGDVQISVPQGWVIATNQCPGSKSQSVVFIQGISPRQFRCQFPSNVIALETLQIATKNLPSQVVNGIRVYFYRSAGVPKTVISYAVFCLNTE